MQKRPYMHTYTKKKKEISILKNTQLKNTSLKKLAQNIGNKTIYTISPMTPMT